MGKQLKYADRKGFRFALIGGPDELQRGVWQVKDLRGKGNAEVAEDDLIEQLRSMFLNSFKPNQLAHDISTLQMLCKRASPNCKYQ